MLKRLLFGLSLLTSPALQALELQNETLNTSFSICETTKTGNFQYDLTLRGDSQLGIISANANANGQRLCASNINAIGQYGQQSNGTYLATLATLSGDTGNCDTWVYQFIWDIDVGTGEITFANDETETSNFELGKCEQD